ncbi:dienelactone hydrolase family protein [Dactylosporangium sp. NPDC000555]|uniref:dienelactone hydrolase family protein n=1 Tax=Dactylosporangium sp. NPDC000555 TaxID=3154260 RepID=UPI00331CF983
MAHVAIFHSVYGLRSVERRAANRLRAAGHHVVAPDLYAGQTGATIEDAFALKDRIGWDTITELARRAVRDLPPDAVLAGFSMGAGVVQELLPDRPGTAGVLLLHGLAAIPPDAAPDLPVELHVADPDPYAPPEHVAAWHAAATAAGADVRVSTYPGVAHFYTDADLPDHDARAAALTWRRALDFLAIC